MNFSHLNKAGTAKIVDISEKSKTKREAKAKASITMGSIALSSLENETSKKGNVLSVAQLAGIMAAKKTHDLIPLCHNIPITSIDVSFKIDKHGNSVNIFSTVKAVHNTGVEMEALTAVTVSALTIYDMIKSIDKSAKIGSVFLVSKKGGKSGSYKA